MPQETFLEMAQRHYDADMLQTGSFAMHSYDGVLKSCSVGCFTHELGLSAADFTGLSEFSGYPVWAHQLQELLFEKLPEYSKDHLEWHVQFATRAEQIEDWDAEKLKLIKLLIDKLGEFTIDDEYSTKFLDTFTKTGFSKEGGYQEVFQIAKEKSESADFQTAQYEFYTGIVLIIHELDLNHPTDFGVALECVTDFLKYVTVDESEKFLYELRDFFLGPKKWLTSS